jgi:hypothetical protein
VLRYKTIVWIIFDICLALASLGVVLLALN